MIYLLTEPEYGMYESERDTVKLCMITEDLNNVVEALGRHSFNTRQDYYVLEVSQDMMGKVLSEDLVSGAGIRGDRFYKNHEPEKTLKIKRK